VLRMISDLAILAFGVGMVFFGFELAVGTWDGTQPTLGIPDGASYIPIIVGGFLTCMFTLTRIVERLAGMKPDEEAFVRHAAGS